MRSKLQKILCLGVLAAPLAFSFPVHAQTVGGSAPPSAMPAPVSPPMAEQPSMMPPPGEEHAEHQKLREERQTLRMEHEQLQSERDTLKTQCMDAKGQDRSDCDAKWRVLKDKMAAWHQQMDAFKAEEAANHNMQASSDHVTWNHPAASAPVTSPTAMAPQN